VKLFEICNYLGVRVGISDGPLSFRCSFLNILKMPLFLLKKETSHSSGCEKVRGLPQVHKRQKKFVPIPPKDIEFTPWDSRNPAKCRTQSGQYLLNMYLSKKASSIARSLADLIFYGFDFFFWKLSVEKTESCIKVWKDYFLFCTFSNSSTVLESACKTFDQIVLDKMLMHSYPIVLEADQAKLDTRHELRFDKN